MNVIVLSSSLNYVFLANGLLTHQFDKSEKANSIFGNRYPSSSEHYRIKTSYKWLEQQKFVSYRYGEPQTHI